MNRDWVVLESQIQELRTALYNAVKEHGASSEQAIKINSQIHQLLEESELSESEREQLLNQKYCNIS